MHLLRCEHVSVPDSVVPVSDSFVPVSNSVVPVSNSVVPVSDSVVPVPDSVPAPSFLSFRTELECRNHSLKEENRSI